jgi:hypothetical protein
MDDKKHSEYKKYLECFCFWIDENKKTRQHQCVALFFAV